MLTNKISTEFFSIDEVEVDENKQVALIEPVSKGKFFFNRRYRITKNINY